MSTGEQRVAWLTAAAAARGGETPSPRDLELWGHLDIRNKAVAEHVLWDNRAAVLAAFDELVVALDGFDGPDLGGPAELGEEPAEPSRAGSRGELDQRPEARFERLLTWRAGHYHPEVAAVSDQDLARLASSGAGTGAEVEQVAARLGAQKIVTRYAAELAAVLGGEPEAVAEPAPEPAPEPVAEPGPVPVPEPEPAPAPSVEEPAMTVIRQEFRPFVFERLTQFAPYSWANGPGAASGHLSAELDGDDVRLAWIPAPAGPTVTLYRIVESSSTWPSGAPEVGGLVGVTTATSGTLRLRGSGPVTYLAVWANQGSSVLDASHSQPVLIGVSQIVWPPRELSAQVTPNRTVAAVLSAPSGSRVEVQRFPEGVTIAYDINREIDRALVGPTGFRDLNPPMGEGIVYAAFCVAELADGSSSVSVPATVEVSVTPEVQQVAVQVRRSATPGAYDISWLPPSHGRVVLYATPERPQVGLENEPRTAEIIETNGLTEEFRISYPPVDLGGIMTITDFAVDPGWVRAHFVAVHWVSDDSVWVGPTVPMVTPRAPGYAQLIERVDAQVITFAWPKGVSVVQAYQGPRGQQIDPVGSEPIAQLTAEEYEQLGGMRITRTLPSNGCAVHLFGVVYLDGQPMYSAAASLDYEGITRLRYQVLPYGADGNPVGPGQQPVTYRIYAEVDDDLHDTPLAVVGQQRRLPLHPQDGPLLAQQVVSLRAGQPTYVAELPAGQTPVFIRLFVYLPPAETGAVAILDPAPYTLQVVL